MGRPWVRQSEGDAAASAVSRFGAEVKPRLQGPGEPEDQLRAPTEALVKSIAQVLGVDAVLHGEVHLADLRARPDHQVDVAGAPVGFIEIKRPGKSADPNTFRGRDAAQWKKLSLLPTSFTPMVLNGRFGGAASLAGASYDSRARSSMLA